MLEGRDQGCLQGEACGASWVWAVARRGVRGLPLLRPQTWTSPSLAVAGLQTGGVAAQSPRAVGVRPWGCLGTRRTGPRFPGSGSWRGEQDGPWVHETGRRAFRATQKEDTPTHFKRKSALKFRESPVPPPFHWCRPLPLCLSASVRPAPPRPPLQERLPLPSGPSPLLKKLPALPGSPQLWASWTPQPPCHPHCLVPS